MDFWTGIHPIVKDWFTGKFGQPTDIQTRGWAAIADGKDVLITAPTGSGKTLAAFFFFLNQLLLEQSGNPGIQPSKSITKPKVLYISPLKALNSDMHRNLLAPLDELYALDPGNTFRQVQIGIRSGDSTPAQRERLLKHPPDILVTTPETLHIMLTSARGRQALEGITAIILDEIHVLLGSKRGSLAALSVERLEHMNPGMQRIGLSATVNPPETAAAFLVGAEPRSCHHISSSMKKDYHLEILLGSDEVSSWWDRQIPVIAREVQLNTSTLIFCNSRRTAEKLALKVNEHLNAKAVFAHHGSLSREYRQWVEEQLKAGSIRAVVATGTLELGIDIGSVDRVLLIQVPFSVSSAIQRAGRAGHQVGQISRAAFVPLHPRDIIGAAAIIPLMHRAESEPITVPQCPLDVLAQMILSEAAGRRLDTGVLFNLIRRAWPYRNLSPEEFMSVLEMLAGRYDHTRIPELRSRLSLGPRESKGLTPDWPSWVEGSEHLALLIYQSGGTIPDRGYYDLRVAGSLDKIGELDEEFVFERFIGDRFTLGNRIWRIDSIDNQKVIVSPSNSGVMIVPFWRADALGAGDFLATQVQLALGKLDRDPGLGWITGDDPNTRTLVDDQCQKALEAYRKSHRELTGVDLPNRNHIIIERLVDPAITPELSHIIIHTFWGSTLNGPLCFILRQRYLQSRGTKIPGLYTDDAVVLSIPVDHEPWTVFGDCDLWELPDLLQRILPGSGIFGTRFRENAGRALLVMRKGFGKRTPLWVHRMKAKDLLSRIADQGDFPLLKETWRSLVNQDFDVPALTLRLQEIARGTTGVSTILSYKPSPLAADLMWLLNNEYLYADDSLPGIETPLSPLENPVVPEIPEKVIREYIGKTRCFLPGYIPETPLEWSLYFQERRILSPEEITELQDFLKTSATPENPDWPHVLELLGECGQWGTIDSWWFHQSLVESLGSGDLELSDGFIEWSRWQGWISPTELAPWGLVDFPGDFITEPNSQSHVPPRAMNPEVFDTLLHYWKRYRSKQMPPLNLSQVRWLTAGLTGLREFGTQAKGGGEDVTRESLGQLFEQFSGYALSPSAFFHGILPSRIPHSPTWLPSREFTRLGYVWQGRGSDSLTFFPASQTRLLCTPGTQSTEKTQLLAYLQQTPGARFGFQSIVDHSGLDTGSSHRELWQAVSRGLVLSDSLEAMEQGYIQGWFSGKTKEKKPPAQSRSRSGFSRPSRSQWADWNKQYESPGNWFVAHSTQAGPGPSESSSTGSDSNGSDSLGKDSDFSAKEDRAYSLIFQLFDRYPILNRQLVSQEQYPFSWSELLPYLRRLELAGELVGGQFCPELGGLQFIRRETAENLSSTPDETGPGAQQGGSGKPDTNHLYPEPSSWYWMHVQDPVAYSFLEPELTRRSGDHWVLCVLSSAEPIPELRPVVFIKSAGKELVLLDSEAPVETLAQMVHTFFRKVYFTLPAARTRVHIQSIQNDVPIGHSLGVALKGLGFQADPKGLMVWKY